MKTRVIYLITRGQTHPKRDKNIKTGREQQQQRKKKQQQEP
jgi:hypothetical protein